MKTCPTCMQEVEPRILYVVDEQREVYNRIVMLPDCMYEFCPRCETPLTPKIDRAKQAEDIYDKIMLHLGMPYTYQLTPYTQPYHHWMIGVKELPGCLSDGTDVQDAFDMINDAMWVWMNHCIRFDLPIPLPGTYKMQMIGMELEDIHQMKGQ